MSADDAALAIAELRSARAIRERCARVLQAGLEGELAHFTIDRSRLGDAARLTAEITRERYPALDIPPHSRFTHFDAGGVARLATLDRAIASQPPLERARVLTDVVVTSVLLDAGAGPAWRYAEAATGLRLGRSEGLAVASLAWVRSGGLSSRGHANEVDAEGLRAVDAASLARAFQVRDDNPLVGIDGRVHLLRALGAVLEQRSDVFSDAARLGALIDALRERSADGELPAETILATLLDALAPIWPGRLALFGVPLGDVWRHPHAGGSGATAGFLPLHKLSQWLSYSLLHPLQVAGVRVRDLDALTGLAEYRNGGLFMDSGVLVPKHAAVTGEAHEAGSEVVVEFRALTVALLDLLAPLVREELGLDASRLPLCAVLEGGTWAAGRALAQRLRSDAGPPLRVLSDGTVF